MKKKILYLNLNHLNVCRNCFVNNDAFIKGGFWRTPTYCLLSERKLVTVINSDHTDSKRSNMQLKYHMFEGVHFFRHQI